MSTNNTNNTNKTYGYVRTSTVADQTTARQIISLLDFGVDEANILADQATGKTFDRPGYKELKRHIRPGDTLVIHELDRLGRKKAETLKEIQFFRDNNIRLKVLNMPTTLREANDLMSQTINNILFELYTMLAQQELETLEKRRTEGINAMPVCEQTGKKVSLRTGRATGRPVAELPDQFEEVYKEWKSGAITAVAAFTKLGLAKATFYRLVKKYEEDQQ